MVDIIDGMTEVEFLQNKAAQGKLIIKTASSTTTTSAVITSYTVPSGSTFVLFKAKCFCSFNTSTGAPLVQLRNNGTVQDEVIHNLSIPNYESVVKGDQLIGDGVKTYDWYFNLNGAALSNTFMAATIIGYLL